MNKSTLAYPNLYPGNAKGNWELKYAAVYLTIGLQIAVYSVGKRRSCRKAQGSPKQLFYHLINIRIGFVARYTILHALYIIYSPYRLFVRSITDISA